MKYLALIFFVLLTGILKAQNPQIGIDMVGKINGDYNKIVISRYVPSADTNKIETKNIGDTTVSLTGHIVQFYNQNGDVEEVDMYNNNDILMWRVTYMYDENTHKLVSGIKQNAKGEISTKYKFIDNAYTKTIEESVMDTTGDVVGILLYNFNNLGKLQNIQTYNAERKLIKTIAYTYDDDNQRQAETHYDDSGATIRSINYNYEYDDRKNWIRRKECDAESGELCGVMERKIIDI